MPSHSGLGGRVKGGPFATRWFSAAIACVTATLALIPPVLWSTPTSLRMNLGGDSSILYFAYPLAWLAHSSVTALSTNLTGYSPQVQYVPLASLALVIQTLGLNAETFSFGLLLAASFLGTVLLALHLLEHALPNADSNDLKLASMLAGIIAVSAPLLAQTQWSSIVPGLFWLALLPWLLYLYLLHQTTGRPHYLFGAALASTLFSIAIPDAPITIGCVIGGALLIVSLAVTRTITFHPARLALFAAANLLVSAFWLLPFAVGFLGNQLPIHFALSGNGKASALAIVDTLAPLQSLQDAMELRVSTHMMLIFQWPEIVPNQWAIQLGLIGLIPAGTIIAALLLPRTHLAFPRATSLLVLLTVSTATLLLLFAPQPWVVQTAIRSLIRWVPGWTAERNFYNAFGPPFVLLLAVTASLGAAVIIAGHRRLRVLRPFMVAAMILLVVYDLPFFQGAYFRLPYLPDGHYNRVTAGLPKDYRLVMDRLQGLPGGALLSLPILTPDWTVIAGPPSQLQGVYKGIPPIASLTARSDYSGVASFQNAVDPGLPQQIQQLLANQDLTAFDRLMKALGVSYVLLDTENMLPTAFYGVGAVSPPLLEQSETQRIAASLAPHVLYRAGPYELRRVVGSKWSGQVALLPTTTISSTSSGIARLAQGLPAATLAVCPSWSVRRVARTSSSAWHVTLVRAANETNTGCSVVLNVPYSRGWTATAVGSRRIPKLRQNSTPALGLFLSFQLPRTSPRTVTLSLGYGPQRFIPIGAGITIASWLLLLVMLLWVKSDHRDKFRTLVRPGRRST